MKLFNYMIITVVMIISAQCVQAMEAHEENDNDYVKVDMPTNNFNEPSVGEKAIEDKAIPAIPDDWESLTDTDIKALIQPRMKALNIASPLDENSNITISPTSQKKSSENLNFANPISKPNDKAEQLPQISDQNISIEVPAKENISIDEKSSTSQKTPTSDDIQQIATIKKIISANKITSPDVISIINNATTMDEINQQFTQLIMTTQDPTTASKINIVTSLLSSQYNSDPQIKELYLLSDQRNSIQYKVNRNYKNNNTINEKITNLENSKTETIADFTNKTNPIIFSESYKDNVTKLYDNAISKLTEQKTAADQVQAQQNEQIALAQNTGVYQIINSKVKQSEKITQLTTLIINSKTEDLAIIKQSIQNSYKDSSSNSKDRLLRIIAIKENIDINSNSVTNLANILTSNNGLSSSDSVAIAIKQYGTQKYIDALSDQLINADSSQNINIAELISPILNPYSKVTLSNDTRSITDDLNNLDLLRKAILNKTPQQNNANVSKALKEISKQEIDLLSSKSKIQWKIYITSIGNYLGLNDKTGQWTWQQPSQNASLTYIKSSLDSYLSTTFTLLSKQGSLLKENIKSTISSIFKQAKVQDPNGKAASSIAEAAVQSVPKDQTNLQAMARWSSGITSMVSDTIFGTSATTNSPQLPNTLNTVPANATPTA